MTDADEGLEDMETSGREEDSWDELLRFGARLESKSELLQLHSLISNRRPILVQEPFVRF